MTRLPSRPDLDWKDDGTPVAKAFDDIYFSRSDGLEETREVFFRACGLPERWSDRNNFTIAELGFGTGLNFLALVQLWLASPREENAWLDFLTVEKHPMAPADAREAHTRWPEISELSEVLIASWPEQTAGLQRIVFPQWRMSLTIYIGDAEDWLQTVDFKADAWFLDGFAPSKNESMWSEAVLQGLGRHSAPGCLVGTYTVAGAVRRGLADAGFDVAKKPGFGRKRERLEAVFPATHGPETQKDVFLCAPPRKPIDYVIVIGGGIAGASVARQFAEAGIRVAVCEAGKVPASGASGNPLGLVMPRLDAADTPQARFLIQSYLYALRFYTRYAWRAIERTSVSQPAQSNAEITRFQKLLADPPLNSDWLEDGSNADVMALLHHQAAIIDPGQVVRFLLGHPLINGRWNDPVHDVKELQRRCSDSTLIVVTSGHATPSVLPDFAPWISGKQGQIEFGNIDGARESEAVASGTYAIRQNGYLLFGATFEAFEGYGPGAISDAAKQENIEAFQRLVPDWVANARLDEMDSRASVRATTPDRFPIAGAVFDLERTSEALAPLRHGAAPDGGASSDGNMYVMTGLGARGFTFAPLLADLIVSQALGRPLPLARSEQEMVSPVRFLVRAIRKGQVAD